MIGTLEVVNHKHMSLRRKLSESRSRDNEHLRKVVKDQDSAGQGIWGKSHPLSYS